MNKDDLFANAAVDRFRRRQIHALTFQQRQQMGQRLIQHAMDLLRASPDGYEAFIKRNFRNRRHRPDMKR